MGDLDSRTRVEPSGAPASPEEAIERGSMVGRYIVSGQLGAGGMGVVYAAYDPELDRKVAIKLLAIQTDGHSSAGSARLLREAQALAWLNHPNVVAIHDVGTLGARVWLAMEYVEGRTLRTWLAELQPRWPEILQVMVAVGQGVAAAHAVGLIHRDLKPDNIMLGSDGRVRVMDFGLARAAGHREDGPIEPTLHVSGRQDALARMVTEQGMIPGTPAYMAPEQWSCAEADARADQFAFCVTAWEALFGERPFTGDDRVELARAVLRGEIRSPTRGDRCPKWLRRVLVRGLQVDREARFPTMEALLAALTAGETRARRWRTTWILVGVATVAATLPIWQSRERARREAACATSGDEIRAVWNEDVAARLSRSLTSTEAKYAATTVEKVTFWLDAWAEGWSTAQVQVCREAELEGTRPAELLARARTCLAERRDELAALLAVIEEDPTASLPRAVGAAASLSPVEACVDANALERRPAPPRDPDRLVRIAELRRELARVLAMLAAGRYVDGLARAEALLAAARPFGDALLLAEIGTTTGQLAEKTGAFERARELLLAAYLDASAVEADELAADIVNSLVTLISDRQAQPEVASQWAHVGEALWRRLGAPEDLRATRRFIALATLHRTTGRHDEAQALLERALALQERFLGPDHPDLARSLNNLGNILQLRGDRNSAIPLFSRSLALSERALGPRHPQVALLLNNLGAMHYVLGDYDEAQALLTRSLALREEQVGLAAPESLDTRENLALILVERRSFTAAIAILRPVLALREQALGPRHTKVADSQSNLARALGQLGALDEAIPLAESAVSIYEDVRGQDDPELAEMLMVLAELLRKRNDQARAQDLFERVLAIRSRTQPTSQELSVALTSVGMGLLLRGESTRGRALLERALAIREALPNHHTGMTQLLHALSWLELRDGALDRAQVFAERALAGASRPGAHEHERIEPLIDLGELALARGRAIDALPPLEQAVELSARGELEPLAYAIAHMKLAQALAATGREPARVRTLAMEAARVFRLLGPLYPESAELEAWLATREGRGKLRPGARR